MTYNFDEFQTADRGSVYEFIERDNTVKNMVLVVSSQHRCEDNIISILLLGTKYTGYDCVPIVIDNTTYYAHCGLVTYAKRNRLGRHVLDLPDDVMSRVDTNIASNLGLKYLTQYKDKYETLLELSQIKENSI